MEKFFTEKVLYNELIEKLNYLFEQNITRFSKSSIIPNIQSETDFFAQQIYKRGILSASKNEDKIDSSKISNSFKTPKITIRDKFSDWYSKDNHLSSISLLIIDRKFSTYHPEVLNSFKAECIYILDASERNKSLPTVFDIFTQLSEQAPPKKISQVIGLGGGITLDIAGFVASILQAKLTLIPTTLLSAVDATIGGKTGVNFKQYGKNQIGSFYFCDEIVVIPKFFTTLSRIELISGLSEALKHSWISGNFLTYQNEFEFIYSEFDKFSADNSPAHFLTKFILQNLQTKLMIVEKDPYEIKGSRNILNFGHTIGHLLETISSTRSAPIPHGIAVAHGMHFVIENFDKLFSSNKKEFEYSLYTYPDEINAFKIFLSKIIKEYPIKDIDIFSNESLQILKQDKKNKNSDTIVFTLPEYGHTQTWIASTNLLT